ncbi:hypothetical protein NMG60_11031808 [Bertholletia excelsa]
MMGKYIKKAKSAGEIALMEVVQSPLGVRTRARTLALQRLQKSSPAPSGGGCYLQLRSRRLEKPPIFDSKRQRQGPKDGGVRKPKLNTNSRTGSRLEGGSSNSETVSPDCLKRDAAVGAQEGEIQEDGNKVDAASVAEASFGENMLEIEGRERSTRESTPCSLIRDPESIRTPGSSTRPASSTDEGSRRLQNSVHRYMPMAHEIDEFFASAEEDQQRQFIEKYNFDPVTDEPLSGRYEWVKLDP